MDKKMRERVLKAANSKGVKDSEFGFWLLLIALVLTTITLIIVFVPGVADWMDGWSPLTVTVCVMIVLLIFYFYTRNKTR